jgi:hypothetical protein
MRKRKEAATTEGRADEPVEDTGDEVDADGEGEAVG